MTETIQLQLSIPEMNLVLEALGSMPYFKVYELIGKMQGAAQRQLQDMGNQKSAISNEGQSTAVAPSNGVHAVT